MPEIYLQKLGNGLLAPASNQDAEKLLPIKLGEWIKCTYSRPRNYEFHKKFFTMVGYAYERFIMPEVELNGHRMRPEKDFDEFRYWLTIKAGYYDIIGYPDGSVRARAKSISFANMEQDVFEKLYSNVLDAAIEHVLSDETFDDVNQIVETMILEYG